MLIFDKSALQALSLDEAVLANQFFMANITPLLYVETLADLSKPAQRRRSADDIVSDVAGKTPIMSAFPNVPHSELVLADLRGTSISMTNRPVILRGEVRRGPDGMLGEHFDQFPEVAALERWHRGAFDEVERLFARQWRTQLSSLNHDAAVAMAKNTVPEGTRLTTLQEVKTFVDSAADSREPAILQLAMELLEVDPQSRLEIAARHQSLARPTLREFAPYAAFVFRVDLFFYLSVASSLISGERPSNRVDIAYLYYLPFCHVFVSNDKLHARTAPLFMEQGQVFVEGVKLKAGFAEITEHYSAFQAEIEKIGLVAFARCPPKTQTNSVTELWDTFQPGWQMRDHDGAVAAEAEGATGKVTELQRHIAQAEPITEAIDPDSVDYALITRVVPMRRGRWKILPDEAAGHNREN